MNSAGPIIKGKGTGIEHNKTIMGWQMNTSRSSLVIFLFFFGCILAPMAEMPKVEFCQMISNFEKYEGQIIHTSAGLFQSPEGRWLFGPECRDWENLVWIGSETWYGVETKNSIHEEVVGILREKRQAKVEFIGKFHGPKKVEAPKNLPPRIAENIRKMRSRYGHLNGFNFMIEILKIEKVEELP